MVALGGKIRWPERTEIVYAIPIAAMRKITEGTLAKRIARNRGSNIVR